MNSDKLITIDQIAEMLSVSKRQAFKLREEGLMPEPIRIKGSIRWKLSVIQQWIDLGCPSEQDFQKLIKEEKN